MNWYQVPKLAWYPQIIPALIVSFEEKSPGYKRIL
jgi:hypothetical protein